jgi:hypothetical protein
MATPMPPEPEPYLTLPVAEFEALSTRAALADHLEIVLQDEHARVRQIVYEFSIPWPSQEDPLLAISSYIGTLQAALKLRELFTQ